MSRLDQLQKIQNDLLALRDSPLYGYRTENGFLPVPGEGNPSAKIMFVGEAPGLNEAKTGRPFCGASGKFLDILLGSIGLKREGVFITSIVKDRPPDNRDPKPAEIAVYAPFLDKQIEIIQPKVIVTLGRHSLSYIMTKFGLAAELQPIGKIHGMTFRADSSFGQVLIVTLYHPAAALHNGAMRATLIEDFEVLRKYV